MHVKTLGFRSITAGILAVALLAAAGGRSQTTPPRVTVIKGATLIDGTGAASQKQVSIVIENNTIKKIGPESAVTYEPDANVIPASGKFVIPGLADAHVHYTEWMPELYLAHGVTTALVPSDGERPWLQAEREGIEKGKIPGPRLLLFGTGGGMSQPEFPIGTKPPVKGTEEARAIVRNVSKFHIEGVKIHVAIGEDLLRAFVEESRKFGLPVHGHLGKVDARQAALAGIHGIAHLSGVAMAMMEPSDIETVKKWKPVYARFEVIDPRYFRGPDPRHIMIFALRRAQLQDELIKLLVAKHVYMDCDLVHIIRGATERRDAYAMEDYRVLADPNLDYVPMEMRQKQQMDFYMFEELSPEDKRLMQQGYRNIQEFIRKFVAAGGKILAGTDAGSVASTPGVSVHRNLELLVDAGLTPAQALAAVTKNFWEYIGLGWDKKVGTIQEGKLADLVVLDADPLANPSNSRRIHLVMLNGKVVDRTYHAGFVNPLRNPDRFGRDARANPAPRLRSIEPEMITEGVPGFEMVLKGDDFVDSSFVKFNGVAVKTKFLNDHELRATVPADMVPRPGVFSFIVYTPQGGGESAAKYLIVKFK